MVVERVRALPGPDRVRARARAVRAQFGPGAAHVWFLAKDPLQFARCRTLQVRPRGLGKADHATVAPTEEQLAVVAAGGGVYWLDGQQVLIPYGVHDFVHTPGRERPGTSTTGGARSGRTTGGSATRCPLRPPPGGGWSRCR